MRLLLQQHPDFAEPQITIQYRDLTLPLQRVITQIKKTGISFIGKREERWYKIPMEDIFYIDVVDGNTFLYCEKQVYLCKEKLYVLEKQLQKYGFIRIRKNTIVHLEKLQSVQAMPFCKLQLYLKNGETLIVSRHYLPQFQSCFFAYQGEEEK